MAFTTEQYNALKDAISLGAKKVEYGDKTVEYRSLAEMMALLNRMETELGLSSGSIVVSNPIVDKGLNYTTNE
jgi:hypothetical protein